MMSCVISKKYHSLVGVITFEPHLALERGPHGSTKATQMALQIVRLSLPSTIKLGVT